VIPFVAVALAVAVAFIALGASYTSHPGDLWFELAKAGMQLFAVGILGAVVAAALRILDDHRQDRRRRDEYRAETAGELLDAYHRIKAVRRKLRAAGFRSPGWGTVSAEQSADFRAQMDLLDDAQLALEKVARDVKAQPGVFQPHQVVIGSKIRQAEQYVHDVISDWEKHGQEVKTGADLSSVMGSFGHFSQFLGRAEDGDLRKGDEEEFKAKVSQLPGAASLIHSLRLGVAPTDSVDD
jgi:hypothetical protein